MKKLIFFIIASVFILGLSFSDNIRTNTTIAQANPLIMLFSPAAAADTNHFVSAAKIIQPFATITLTGQTLPALSAASISDVVIDADDDLRLVPTDDIQIFGTSNDGLSSAFKKDASNYATLGVKTTTPNNALTVNGDFNFASDTSTANQVNIYDLVMGGFIGYSAASIIAGTQVNWVAGHGNTGACNILVNALAQKDLFKMHDQELASGDIEAGQVVTAVYDGTQWQMTSQIAQ